MGASVGCPHCHCTDGQAAVVLDAAEAAPPAVAAAPVSSNPFKEDIEDTAARRISVASCGEGRADRDQASTMASTFRALAAVCADDAWAELRPEYETQELVWTSAGLVRGARFQERVSVVRSHMQEALGQAGADPQRAVHALEAALQASNISPGGGKGEDAAPPRGRRGAQHGGPFGDAAALNPTVAELVLAVIEAEKVAAARRHLAERLEACAKCPAGARPPLESFAQAGLQQQEVEALVAACKLQDPKLFHSALRTLTSSLYKKEKRDSNRRARPGGA